jgi:hypothetical protein
MQIEIFFMSSHTRSMSDMKSSAISFGRAAPTGLGKFHLFDTIGRKDSNGPPGKFCCHGISCFNANVCPQVRVPPLAGCNTRAAEKHRTTLRGT